LKELGITGAKNDIRFVDDNWKSPTMGAFGIGWEVWLNGMEISQFTYMQKLGGRDFQGNIALELTYGLERIEMHLQNKQNVFEIEWGGGKTYGDLFKENEMQGSRFNFEKADPKQLRQSFNKALELGKQLAGGGNYIPAWEQCLQMSHCFNLLDSLAVIGTTEREQLVIQVRELARAVADAVVEARGY